MPKSKKLKKKQIKEKICYLENYIEDRRDDEDNLAFGYLYDVLDFILARNFYKLNLDKQIREDIKHNVIKNLIVRRKNLKEGEKINLLYTYLSKMIIGELSRLDTDKYLGRPYVDFDSTSSLMFDPEIYINNNSQDDMEKSIFLEDNCKVLIHKLKEALLYNSIPVKNKELLLFSVILCISRRDFSIIKSLPLRVRIIIKELYEITGEPIDCIKL